MHVLMTDKLNSGLQGGRGVRKVFRKLLNTGFFGLVFFSTGLMALPKVGQDMASFAPPDSSQSDASSVEVSRDEELLKQIQATMRENLETIQFIRNDGQWNKEVLYKGTSATGQVNVTSTGLKFITPQQVDGSKGFHNWSMSFKNSPGINGIVPSNPDKLLSSYHGKSRHISAVPAVHELLLQQVYPGIDLRLYSREAGKLEFDWLIAPGVDYRQIQLQVEGIEDLDLSNPDQLSIALHMSTVDMHIPESYQIEDSEKLNVQVSYELLGDNLLAYHVEGEINPELPLVIDPELNWGTWFDGSHTEYEAGVSDSNFDQYLNAIDVAPCSDLDGNTYQRCVYAGGTTNIDIDISENGYISYPASKGITEYDESFNGGTPGENLWDAVVYVLTEDGSNILYATHFGGTGLEKGYGVSVSPEGGTVYLSGSTESNATDQEFPITDGTGGTAAFEPTRPGGTLDGFVAAFDITLQTLKYSSYIGTVADGSISGGQVAENVTSVRAISDDSYVIGSTMGAKFSDEDEANGTLSKYISANAPDKFYSIYSTDGDNGTGAYTQYIAQFSGFNNLTFGTYVNGNYFDQNNDTIILENGDIAFVGVTFCNGNSCGNESFPALVNDLGAEATACTANNKNRAVVGVVDPANSDSSFKMLSRMGGCQNSEFFGVIELDGNLYVGGKTDSTDFPLGTDDDPLYVPYQDENAGSYDGIFGYLPPAGGDGNWRGSYIGGSDVDIVNAVAGFFDGVFLYGTTASDGAGANGVIFPTQNVGNGTFFSAAHAIKTRPFDIFFSTVSLDLEELIFSTMLGGPENDYLGDTGNPRGSNHIYADDSYLWLGTTIHSNPDNFTHPLTSLGSFDDNKSNATGNGPDSHIIFRIGRVGTTITLVKDVTGGTSLPSEFTLTVQGLDGVNDSGVNYIDGSEVAVEADVVYTIDEINEINVGVGYSKTGIVCTHDDIAGNPVVGSANGTGGYEVTPALGDNITCTVSNLANSTPQLTLLKEGVGPLSSGGLYDYSAVGDDLVYTYTVTNSGDVNLAAPVTISDNKIPTQNIICPTLDDGFLNVGEVTICEGTYDATQVDIDNGQVYNLATATADGVESNEADETLIPELTPLIELEKTGTVDDGGDGIVNAGDRIIYQFTVTNTGNVTLDPVTVEDRNDDVVVLGGPVSLAPTEFDAVTFTGVYTIKQLDIDLGGFYNIADTLGVCVNQIADDCSVDDDDDDLQEFPQLPAISLVKTGSFSAGNDGITNPGDLITYNLRVTNTGNVTLSPVVVTDSIIADADIVCAGSSGSNNTIDTMAPDQVFDCSATYAIDQGDIQAGTVHNDAIATGDCANSQQAPECSVNDEDDHDEPLGQDPAISIVKTGDLVVGQSGFANPGDLINYSFLVTNTGNVVLYDVEVTDPLLASVNAVISCTPEGNPIDDMAPQEQVTCTGSYPITSDDIFRSYVDNTATVTGNCVPDNGTTCATDEDDHREPMPGEPSILLLKDGVLDLGGDGANPGDLVAYTFTVTNNGYIPLDTVTVTDPLLAGRNVDIDCGGDGDNVFGPLAVDASQECTASMPINQDDINSGSVYNIATADGEATCINDDGEYECEVDDTDDHTVTIPRVPDILIEKSGIVNDGNLDVGAGDDIDYTFVVTNTGNVELTNVAVTDTIVSNIQCIGESNPIASMAVGAQVTCTGSYTLLDSDIIAGHRDNTARAEGQCTVTALCPTDDEDEHDSPLPRIDLAKTAGEATLMPDGTYTVVYTVAASNTGQADGIYHIDDNFVPATGLTLSANPTIVYGGGETQTGTIGTYPALVAGEGLAVGAGEVWTITANFNVDPTVDLTDARSCEPGTPSEEQGFYNYVGGSKTDINLANNSACTNLPLPEMDLVKTISGVEFTGVNQQTVTYVITANNTGDGPAIFDIVDNLDPGNGIVPVLPATVTYVAISDNFASPVTQPPGWPTISSNETLSGQSSESWQVEVVFNIDSDAAGFVDTQECSEGGGEFEPGYGFYNKVAEIDGETDYTNNDVCTTPSLAYLTLVKVLENNDNGSLTEADFPITVTGVDGTHNSGVDYHSGDAPPVTVGVGYTISEDDVDPDYSLISIECVDDSDSSDMGTSFSLVDNQSVTCTVTNSYKELLIESLAEVCINDVPYVSYDVTTIGLDPLPTEVEIRFYSDGGNGSTDPADYTTLVETLPARTLAGQELWPGATVDQNGNGLTWPGWDTLPDGTWIEVDDGLVPSLLMTFEINPESSQIVNYPPRTSNCVPPDNPPPPPPTTVPVPVDSPLAIILMILSMLGMGWYFRPGRVR